MARNAVAGVVLERVRRPGWWGRDVVTVCTHPFQFSSMTDPRDVQLTKWPQVGDTSWGECLAIAAAALDGGLQTPVPGATYYFDDSLAVPPFWATKERFVGKVGRLNFYAPENDREVA